MIERREHPRQKVYRVGVKVASRDSFRASYLRDLSLGGLFVRSQSPLAIGSAVAIELTPPDHPVFSILGKVVRHEDGGFGVQFDEPIEAGVRATLDALIADYPEDVDGEGPSPDLGAELAEARGRIEAYEEVLAQLRESEADLTQRLEAAETEREALRLVAQALKERADTLESDRAEVATTLIEASTHITSLKEELTAQSERARDLSAEVEATHALFGETREEHAKELQTQVDALRKKNAAELQASAAARTTLEAQLKELQSQLEGDAFARLRNELRDVTGELDQERMKTLALERALQRFISMGGKPE